MSSKYRLYIVILLLALTLISCQKREKIYYDNGKIKEIFQLNAKGEKHGKFESFYENGKILEKSEYKNGLLEGKRYFYYENGEIEEIQMFEEGKLKGEQLGYHENGVLKFKCFNEGNKLEGKYLSYYDNGKKLLYLNFINDLENGPFEEYYTNEVIKWKGTYRNGNKEFGLLEQFDEKGELIKKMNCDTLGMCTTIWKKETVNNE
jgi:antitoxin component YwqK of YwqJK toxin-antitoxin module